MKMSGKASPSHDPGRFAHTIRLREVHRSHRSSLCTPKTTVTFLNHFRPDPNAQATLRDRRTATPSMPTRSPTLKAMPSSSAARLPRAHEQVGQGAPAPRPGAVRSRNTSARGPPLASVFSVPIDDDRGVSQPRSPGPKRTIRVSRPPNRNAFHANAVPHAQGHAQIAAPGDAAGVSAVSPSSFPQGVPNSNNSTCAGTFYRVSNATLRSRGYVQEPRPLQQPDRQVTALRSPAWRKGPHAPCNTSLSCTGAATCICEVSAVAPDDHNA